PPLLYFLARERWLQEGIKEQVEGVIDARGSEERTGESQTVASGKAAQTTGQGFDRLGQLQARETLTATAEQAGRHVIDAHVAFIVEQQPAEHHRLECHDRDRVMFLDDQADAVVEPGERNLSVALGRR